MKEESAKRLNQALDYAARGWRVIHSHWPIGKLCPCPKSLDILEDTKTFPCGHAVPVCSCGKPHDQLRGLGKHPIPRDWVNQATTNASVIRSWLTVKPEANVSIVTGKESGIFVLDIDPDNGGITSMEGLMRKYLPLPLTPTFQTGSGGFHHLFKHPGWHIPTKSELAPGVDIRGDGGQIIAPPSRNVNGPYEIDPDAPITLPVADAPDWLLGLISSSQTNNFDPSGRKSRFNIQDALNGVEKGRRDETIFKLACKMRDEDIPMDMALDWIRRAAANCDPAFPERLAEEKVKWAYNRYEPRVDWNRNVLQQRNIPRQVGREWIKPYPLGSATGAPFPSGMLPDGLERYVRMVARDIQVPESMVAALALSSIAACVAKKGVVRIIPSWKETLNIYTVVACPPSSRKSPTFAEVTQPIFDYEKRRIEEFENNKGAIHFEHDALKLKLDKMKKDFSKKDADAEALLKEGAAIQQRLKELEALEAPRMLADDVTPEKLAGLLFRNKERIALMSADANDIFKQMGAKYKTVADPTLYIKGWSGDTKIVDRMGRFEYLNEPIITMGLAVQPKVMRGVGLSESANQGLLARFLYCFPEDIVGKRKVNYNPFEVLPDNADHDTRQWYLTRLKKLIELRLPELQIGVDGKRYDGMNVLSFDDDALKGFLDFENSLEEERERTFDDAKREWLGKLGGNTARLIAILHLVENIDLCEDPEDVWKFPIMGKTVESGVKLGEWFMSHMVAAFEEMQSDPIKNYGIALVKWIRELKIKDFHRSEAIQALGTAGEKASSALTFLTERGYIRTSDPLAQLNSRDNIKYEVNPHVLNDEFRSIDKEDVSMEDHED